MFPEEDIIMISSDGIVIRIAAEEIRQCARPSKGVRVMRVQEGEKIVRHSLKKIRELPCPGKVYLTQSLGGETIPLLNEPGGGKFVFAVFLADSLNYIINSVLPDFMVLLKLGTVIIGYNIQCGRIGYRDHSLPVSPASVVCLQDSACRGRTLKGIRHPGIKVSCICRGLSRPGLLGRCY